MKPIYLTLLLGLLSLLPATACPLCKKNQPAGFANITHGVGPQNGFDYVMLYGSIGVVVITLGLLVWFVLRPDHATVQPADFQIT
ncbi:MAG: hypothetical protein H7319_05655 [Spirosoma sp.]|nr:hypothetical protein [Spirosoma sp.]